MANKISIETLRKITFENIDQMLQDLNRNFAIIQNSPLFKGIPGKPGDPGDQGLRGIRGSNFIFIKFDNFVKIFPGETPMGSSINLDYLNSKLLSFEEKQKLLNALEVNELVDNDVIVLTNSEMLSYDGINNLFEETGIAFNQENNFVSSIEEKIEEYVKYYVENNPVITSLHNVFEDWETIAKNYSSTNNTFITKSNSKISVYFPTINGDDGIGLLIENHKHFGFTEDLFPVENNGTTVIGSMRWYYKLLSQTISTSISNPLTSDYVPTSSNIPSLVVLQDTYKNGIWIGYKGSGDQATTKRFASIFKNENNEFVLKSDSGNIESEFSALKLHRNYMSFNKLVQFLADQHLTGNLEHSGNIKQAFIRTGMYTKTTLKDDMELGITNEGNVVEGSRIFNFSDEEIYAAHKGIVFVTDNEGLLLKTYSIEKSQVTVTPDLNEMAETPDNVQTILTSNYFARVVQKINNICRYVVKNYWRKDQYETGEIPGLKVSGNLECLVDLKVGRSIESPLLTTSVQADKVTIGKSTTVEVNNCVSKIYPNFKSLVLVTDASGNVLKTYSIEKTTMNQGDLTTENSVEQVTVIPSSNQKVLTSNYLQFVLTKINNMCSWIKKNLWRKDQFETGEIPGIEVANNVSGGGELIFPMLTTNQINNTVEIGLDGDGTTTIKQTNLKLPKYNNNVLVTDANGNVSHNYSLETRVMNDSDLPANVLIQTSPGNNANKVVTDQHIDWICKKINNIIQYVIGNPGDGGGSGGSGGDGGSGNYWRKDQFPTGIIPGLKVSEYLKTLKALFIGDENSPILSSDVNSNETNIGKKDGSGKTFINNSSINFPQYKNLVLVTDGSGLIIKTYSIETMITENSLEDVPQNTTDEIVDTPFPSSENKIVTSNYLASIWRCLNNIKARLKNTFNKEETIASMYNHVQVGTIVEWSIASSQLLESLGDPDLIEPKTGNDPSIPKGWVICDGRMIPNSSITTPNMCDRFTRMVAKNGTLKQNANRPTISNGEFGGSDSITIPLEALPSHSHSSTSKSSISGSGNATFPKHNHGFLGIEGQNIGNGGKGARAWSNNETQTNDAGPFNVSVSLNNVSIKTETKIHNFGDGQPFNHVPSCIYIWKIMKYKSN